MVNVLVLDGVSESGVQILKKDFNVDVMGSLSNSELKDIIGKYDALLVRSQTKVNKETIDASNLKIIARAGVGVDNIDVDAATKKGVIVVNSPDGNTIAAAEHTIAMILSLSRYIPSANSSLKKGEWKRKEFTGVELYNKTLGFIGFGRIGSHVSKVCKALGMKVMVFDPYISSSKAEELNIEVVDLNKLFSEADFITIHVPLTAETSNLINLENMKKMKKTTRIVNCSRGGIINESDLVYALENNIIAGAALDVFETEPLKESPLQNIQDKLIITPHLGASTQEAQVNVSVDVAEQVSAFFKGEKVKSAVNLAGMEISESIKPYVDVALKLGMFLGQATKGNLKNLYIKYLGDISDTEQDT
ncbi:MAG: phosphoglycerate dehydrogenase, partial [Candidatus Sericytochromatia bacterium]